MDLMRVDIVADVTEATFVEFGVNELVLRLQHLGTLHHQWSDELANGSDPLVIIGSRSIIDAGLEPIVTPADPGPEGYAVVRTSIGARETLLIAGSDPQGTKFGLLAVLRSLSLDGSELKIADVRTRPAFRMRAMYGHLHWSYNWPYALRRWSLTDWMGYVDHLSHLGANMLAIWTMLAMRPQPLSEDDAASLRLFGDVIEYARTCRGMDIWLGENANNLAGSDLGRPMADRPYFGTQRLVDPASPEGLKEILDSRRSLFELVPGISGHWLSDSDPGHWPRSPSSDFVDIVVRTQELVREFTPEARTAYWAHVGWGVGTRVENYRDVMAGLKERLIDPWDIFVGTFGEHAEVADELGLLDRAIWLPYGWGEGEPTPPLTLATFEDSRSEFEKGLGWGIDRAMAQAQTPTVQLPRIFALMTWMWDSSRKSDDASALTDELAALMFPDAAEAIAEGWRALSADDPAAVEAAVHTLVTALARGLGRPGELARGLPGGHRTVAEDLLYILKIRWKAVAIQEAVRTDATPETVGEEVASYIRAVLRWQRRNGYVPMGGPKFVYGDYLAPVREAWDLYRQKHGVMQAYPEVLWIPKAKVIDEGEFHWALVDGVVTEMTSTEAPSELD